MHATSDRATTCDREETHDYMVSEIQKYRKKSLTISSFSGKLVIPKDLFAIMMKRIRNLDITAIQMCIRSSLIARAKTNRTTNTTPSIKDVTIAGIPC